MNHLIKKKLKKIESDPNYPTLPYPILLNEIVDLHAELWYIVPQEPCGMFYSTGRQFTVV